VDSNINYHLACVKKSTPASLTLSSSAPLYPTVETLPLSWPIAHGHFSPHGSSLVQAFWLGSAKAICDGLYMPCCYPHLATAAWIIHMGSSGMAACHGVTQVHRPPLTVNSYHTELQGTLSLILVVNQLCSTHTLTMGSLSIGCNNKGVL